MNNLSDIQKLAIRIRQEEKKGNKSAAKELDKKLAKLQRERMRNDDF